jgi:carboxylesterase
VGCLVIHGFTGSPHEVHWLGEHMNQQGYTVYGPRLAGHGTTPQDMARSSWREWYADVLAGYLMLRARCHRVFPLGLSMGGSLALMLASHEKVDGVVAMSAPYRMSLGWRWIPVTILSLTGGMLPKLLPSPEQYALLQAVIAEQLVRGEKPSGRACYTVRPARSVIELARLLDELRAGLRGVTAPALLMHSRADNTVPFHALQQHLDAISSTEKQTLILEDSDHVITQDHDRGQVYQAAAEFVAAHC